MRISDDGRDTRPTLAERYSVAVGGGTGTAHIILAAGMQHEALGVMLMRLQGEYDTVRAEMERAGHIAPQSLAALQDLRRRAEMARRTHDEAAAVILLEAAAQLRQRSDSECRTARALILVRLESLHAARQALGTLAMRLAKRPGSNIRPRAAMAIAGQVLDVWLDPTCHTCDGTGAVGSAYAGDTQRTCGTCCGSGHRRDVIGQSDVQRRYAGDLLAEIQRRVAMAAGGISRALAPE